MPLAPVPAAGVTHSGSLHVTSKPPALTSHLFCVYLGISTMSLRSLAGVCRREPSAPCQEQLVGWGPLLPWPSITVVAQGTTWRLGCLCRVILRPGDLTQGAPPPPTPVVRGLPLVIMELPQREQEPRNPSYFPLPGQWSRPVCEWSEKPCSSIKDWMGLGPMQQLADPPV